MKIYKPTKEGILTQGYGLLGTKPNMIPFYNSLKMIAHNGMDWNCPTGTNLYWNADCYGKVVKMDNDYYGGWGLEILTQDKDGAFKHRFWHLQGYAPDVGIGDIVSTGDLIAKTNNTGKGTTGAHLHYDIKKVTIKDGVGGIPIYTILDYNNGFKGCVDIGFYFVNIFVLDKMKELEGKLSLLQKLLEALKKLWDIVKPK